MSAPFIILLVGGAVYAMVVIGRYVFAPIHGLGKTNEQLRLLDERLAARDSRPDASLPWAEVHSQQLESKLPPSLN